MTWRFSAEYNSESHNSQLSTYVHFLPKHTLVLFLIEVNGTKKDWSVAKKKKYSYLSNFYEIWSYSNKIGRRIDFKEVMTVTLWVCMFSN